MPLYELIQIRFRKSSLINGINIFACISDQCGGAGRGQDDPVRGRRPGRTLFKTPPENNAKNVKKKVTTVVGRWTLGILLNTSRMNTEC